MQRSAVYSIVFAAAVCLACAIFVASAAVSLRDRQEANAFLDKQRNVLVAAGLAEEWERLTPEEIDERFEPIESVVIDLETGEELPDVDPASFDEEELLGDPDYSILAPENRAGIERMANWALVYKLEKEGELEVLVLPIRGKGLWSELFGFLALGSDLRTIEGITFYEHQETPGLGGEVDNPDWKALWEGRKAYDDGDIPRIQVIRGQAGPPEEDPYRVDGLSGATITSRGVSNLVQFWLSDEGFGPYLDRLREQQEDVNGESGA